MWGGYGSKCPSGLYLYTGGWVSSLLHPSLPLTMSVAFLHFVSQPEDSLTSHLSGKVPVEGRWGPALVMDDMKHLKKKVQSVKWWMLSGPHVGRGLLIHPSVLGSWPAACDPGRSYGSQRLLFPPQSTGWRWNPLCNGSYSFHFCTEMKLYISSLPVKRIASSKVKGFVSNPPENQSSLYCGLHLLCQMPHISLSITYHLFLS